jgi:transcriptional regulator with XRE-family HTH domain
VSLTSAEFNFQDCQVALGRAVRLTRENKHLTQAELAERIGLKEKAVARIEDGEAIVDLSMVVELTKGLRVRFGELGHLVDQYLGRT